MDTRVGSNVVDFGKGAAVGMMAIVGEIVGIVFGGGGSAGGWFGHACGLKKIPLPGTCSG